LRAAGAAVKATDIVISAEYRHAFCNVRPPGHHAEHCQGMGFCFFNNIAIAACYALQHHGLERVAIVDFDVHHGNGTEDIVADKPNILYCSTFQSPLYPNKSRKSQKGQLVNVALEPESGSKAFRDAVVEQWLPELEAFKPELIFISAGFDAHRDEFIAGLNLVEDDFAWVTEALCKLADKYAQGRIVSVLEGGYELSALGRSAVAHIKVLMEC
ncbi:MAG: histone deacetylase family protein, partial [Aquificaceae bacterium]